jgi:hypothetical protein
MSLLTSIRGRAKHRGKSVSELYAEIARLEGENNDLVCNLIVSRGDLRQTAFQLGESLYERQDDKRIAGEAQEELILVADERDQLKADLAEARSVCVPVIGERDTSRIEDQATHPEGIRHIGAEFPHDYLDRTRQAWQPVPLADSPLAKAPVGPAVLEVRLDEPTAENRFPATARIADPDRLLSRLLDEAGSVTVGRDPRTA